MHAESEKMCLEYKGYALSSKQRDSPAGVRVQSQNSIADFSKLQ